jgi:hypothetical protein
MSMKLFTVGLVILSVASRSVVTPFLLILVICVCALLIFVSLGRGLSFYIFLISAFKLVFFPFSTSSVSVHSFFLLLWIYSALFFLV